ncbi:MAG: DNA-binding protein [Alphaproteobacteria bacterium]|nr:DNA-binding protein [Alphaproteobacteria bacterium]
MEQQTVNQTPVLMTIKDFSKKHTFISESALRNKVFYAEENGMQKMGVIKKLGKRVYIEENCFFQWLDSLQ